MSVQILHERTIALLERGLDGSAFRQGVLSGNVANLETPGYHRYDMDFAGYLDEGLQAKKEKLPMMVTHEKHFPHGPEKVKGLQKELEDFTVRQDSSGVDVEKEMTLVLQNTLYHQTLSRLISDKLNGLRTVAREVR